MLVKKGYSCSAIVWGWPEGNVPWANQMKFNPSVMVWGGMTGHGLTDLHFVPQEMNFDSDYYIDNILQKIVKLAFNDNVVHRNLFRQLNLGLFQQMVQDVTRPSNQFVG